MPYTYAFDFRYRETHKKFIKNSIMIFDEAHNIENQAQSGSSVSLSILELKIVERDLKILMELCEKPSLSQQVLKISSNLSRLCENLVKEFNHLNDFVLERG